MQLSELLTSLSLGVLQNLAVGGGGSGSIPAQHMNKVVSAVNQGLTALYTRFQLVEKEVIVRSYDALTTYPLKRIYADSNAAVVPQKFIADTPEEPFLEDVIKVLSIYDEAGTELSFNSSEPGCTLFTPNFYTLQILAPVTGVNYYVLYQARHATLSRDPSQTIDLPIVLNEALECFVAYKILSSMNGQEHAAKAMEHFARYDAICTEAVNNDTLTTSFVGQLGKLDDRGFI